MLTGEHGRVVEIHGGGGLHSRMAALGFTPGVEVIILQNCRPGSLIACVREARVALGHGEASQILVEWKGRDGGDAPCE